MDIELAPYVICHVTLGKLELVHLMLDVKRHMMVFREIGTGKGNEHSVMVGMSKPYTLLILTSYG